ncbi:MAG: DUF4304 domain-containing protein [Burkholderiaceae bacterium]|nr:DUF4304 domain-containing protein [Burkholderiaceae bacterium]
MNEHLKSPRPLPGSEEKKQESRDAQKVLRLLAKRLKPLGFERTKPTFFTRSGRYVLEFVHVHKFTFGPEFRVHFGVRVRSDELAGAHLNGPDSGSIAHPEAPNRRRYNFSFTSSSPSWELCAEAMLECVSVEGLRWFESFTNPIMLLSSNSPLSAPAMTALKRELEEPSGAQASEATRRALNVT